MSNILLATTTTTTTADQKLDFFEANSIFLPTILHSLTLSTVVGCKFLRGEVNRSSEKITFVRVLLIIFFLFYFSFTRQKANTEAYKIIASSINISTREAAAVPTAD